MRTQVWKQRRIHFQFLNMQGDEERLQEDGRDKLRKNSLSVLNTFQVVDCHPKTLNLQQAARNGTSPSNVLSLSLSLQETAHHGLGLREFHTSQGYSVLGSTLTQPRGEINTPAGPRKRVRMCASTLVNVQACTHTSVCVCTHSCVSSMTHIPIFLLLRKLVDPGMCWYLGGVPLQAQLLWPKTKCHWLSNAFHGTTSVLSITTNSDFVVCSLYNDSFPKNCNISLGLQYYNILNCNPCTVIHIGLPDSCQYTAPSKNITFTVTRKTYKNKNFPHLESFNQQTFGIST